MGMVRRVSDGCEEIRGGSEGVFVVVMVGKEEEVVRKE